MQMPHDEHISWKATLLALLPGIFALSYELGLWQLFDQGLTLPRRDYYFALLVFCMLLCLISFVQQGQFAVWSYPALGIVLTSLALNAAASLFFVVLWGGIIGVMIAGWRGYALPWGGWQRWLLALLMLNTALAGFYVDADSLPPTPYEQAVQMVAYPLLLLAIFHVPPAFVGYLLARQTGALAGLVMLGATFVVWDGIGDPAYALYMHTDNAALVRVVALHPHLFFLILAPLLVLRARSNRVRVLSFLLPLTLAFCSADTIRSAIHPIHSFGRYLIVSTVWILVPLSLALVLYLDSPNRRMRQRLAALLNR